MLPLCTALNATANTSATRCRLNENTWWDTTDGKRLLDKHNGANGDRQQIHLLMLNDRDMLGAILALTRGKQKVIARYSRYLLAEMSGNTVLGD